MTDILEFMGERQDWISERYQLVRERMEELIYEDDKELFQREFLSELALFLVDCMRVYDLGTAQILEELPEETRRDILHQLQRRAERLRSLAEAEDNPIWAGLLQVIYELYMPCAAYSTGREQLLLTIHGELFVQLDQAFRMYETGEETEKQTYRAMKEAVYYHLRDYCDIMLAYDLRKLLEKSEIESEAVWVSGGLMAERIRGYGERLLAMTEEEYRAAVQDSIRCDCLYQREKETDAGKDRYPGEGDTVILVISGLEAFAYAVGQTLKNQGRRVRYAVFWDTVWNHLMLGCGEQEAGLFFDRDFQDRIFSEEKNILERNREDLGKLTSVLMPAWSVYKSSRQWAGPEKYPAGSTEESDRKDCGRKLMEKDRKDCSRNPMEEDRRTSGRNGKRYAKYIREVQEMRETFACGIDGRIGTE